MARRGQKQPAASNPTSPNPQTPKSTVKPLDTSLKPSTSPNCTPSIDHTCPPVTPARTRISPKDVLLSKIKNVDLDLRPFLKEELNEKMKKKITKIQLYRILIHFNPLTTARPTHPKPSLVSNYKNEVEDLIQPYFSRFDSQAHDHPIDRMETDEQTKYPDFDPLSRKTTCQMLVSAIERRVPGIDIPKSARHEGLLWLYKAHIDRDLVIPPNPRWTQKPRTMSSDRLQRETVEDLCFALQVHAPHIFIHSVGMIHWVLVCLYKQFVLEDSESVSQKIVCGFHYSIIEA